MWQPGGRREEACLSYECWCWYKRHGRLLGAVRSCRGGGAPSLRAHSGGRHGGGGGAETHSWPQQTHQHNPTATLGISQPPPRFLRAQQTSTERAGGRTILVPVRHLPQAAGGCGLAVDAVQVVCRIGRQVLLRLIAAHSALQTCEGGWAGGRVQVVSRRARGLEGAKAGRQAGPCRQGGYALVNRQAPTQPAFWPLPILVLSTAYCANRY